MKVTNENLPTKEEMLEWFSDVELRPLDIETTGLSRSNDHVIELGMVIVNCGERKKEGNFIYGGGKSSPQSLAVHGITDESREGRPTFADRAHLFKAMVEQPSYNKTGKEIPTIFVGHNIDKFDLPFLLHKCREAGHPVMTKDGYLYTIDTCKVAKKHLSAPDYKLETLCKVYGVKHGGHRGLGDTYSCLDILCVCMKKGKFKHVLDLVQKQRV